MTEYDRKIEKKHEELRHYISPFIDGPNANALIDTLADEILKGEKLSTAIRDQLFISTAGGDYLDKKLGDEGIARPPELGMDDEIFRRMGIQINDTKQIMNIINTILVTFYGPDAVRAWTQSTQPEPYRLGPGMTLILQLDNSEIVQIELKNTDFFNILQASAAEVADVVTRFLRSREYNGYARDVTDPDTGETFVRMYGGALGPFSMLNVLGGEVQTVLEFPQMRGTELNLNNTVWEVTKNTGNTIRFRWTGGTAPVLDKVFVGDISLIYGEVFRNYKLEGSYRVSNVRPANIAPAYDAGWFEIQNPSVPGLRNSLPDQAPPVNDPGAGLIYTWTIAQQSYYDLKFFKIQKNTSYSKPRFALGFEPALDLLKIYLPATTQIIARKLKGASHLHNLYPADNFDGAFGSMTDDDSKVVILNDYAISYKTGGYDNYGFDGLLTYDGNVTRDIEYVYRENGYTTVRTTTPHGLTGTADEHGRVLCDRVVLVEIYDAIIDADPAPFFGPYVVDPEANYALTAVVHLTSESIIAGSVLKSLAVKGLMPNIKGRVMLNLGHNNQEGPIDYYGSQTAQAPTTTAIVSISQVGTVVNVTTNKPHGAIVGSKVVINGTANFNGTYAVTGSASPTSLRFKRTPPTSQSETTGLLTLVVEGAISTIAVDPSYSFKFDHDAGSSVSLLSAPQAYRPAVQGLDYASYITGTAEARIYAETLIRQITASGIKLEIVIVYPSDVGLGNQGGSSSYSQPPTSDKVYVWGADD